MTEKKPTSFDDYYAHIPAASSSSEDISKKSGLKLKVKVKKVEVAEGGKQEETISISNTEAPQTKKALKEKHTPSIIWSPKSDKKESDVSTPTTAPRTPFSPRTSGQPGYQPRKDGNRPQFTGPRTSSGSTPGTKTILNTAPEFKNKPTTPSGGNEARTFSDNKPKRGGRKDIFAFDNRRNAGRKTLKTRGYAEDDGFRRSGKSVIGSKKERNIEEIKQTLVDKTGQEVLIPEILTIKEFSEKIGIPLTKIITELMKNGMMVTINTKIDFDTCFLIGEIFGITIKKEINTETSMSSLMEGDIGEILKKDESLDLLPRAPIVSVMGHVDHGKTSILDYIRNTGIAKDEAGGITQKIGAYQVEKNGKKITFLDTPGHEAFSIMRARGAKLTDLAVIVIAGDEGMKPQTIESINHAREANVPMIIAVNKMDKPGANVELIYGQLAEQELQPEAWGGNIVVVPVSAHTGLGIETLLDMILLSTEMMELKAAVDRPAIATVIESHLDARQ